MIALASKIDVARQLGGDDTVRRARRFYCDLLEGRQMAAGAVERVEGALRFLVAGVAVETGAAPRDTTTRVVLRVHDPENLAARCWNAGYTVFVDDTLGVGIVDPFGLRIELRAA